MLHKPQFPCGPEEVGFQFLIAGFPCPRSGDGNDIPSTAEFPLVEPIDLPKTAADAVAMNRLPHLGPHSQTEAVLPRPVFPTIQHYRRKRKAFTLGVDPAETVIAFQGYRIFHQTRSVRSESQFLAALRSAAGQDLAAVRGGHSLAEAVDFAALTLLGLVGSERGHGVAPPEKYVVPRAEDPLRYTRRRLCRRSNRLNSFRIVTKVSLPVNVFL